MKTVLFIFGQLTDEDVEWLSRLGRPETVATGTRLIRRGDAIDSVYIVLDGEFEVSRPAGPALARLGAGEMLGEMSFVDASRPSADVMAIRESRVLRVPRDELERRLRVDNGFAARFYLAIAMMLSDRLRESSARSTLPVPEGVLEKDELDPNAVEGMSRAGERFARLLRAARA